LAPLFAQDQDHAGKIKDIRRLLVLMEAEKATNQVFDQMAMAMKDASPDGDSFLQAFRKEMTMEKMMEIAVASYDKYLSHDDVREMIRFYDSPVGHRLVEAMPKITNEMTIQSMALSQEIAKKLIEKAKEPEKTEKPAP
jgi:hypothetical protein